MCWSEAASVGMASLGAVATVAAARQGQPKAIWLTFGYFTIMEVLQIGGYMVIDQCGNPTNQAITMLSFLHVALQPIVINAFILEMLPAEVKLKLRKWVYLAAITAAAVMVLQAVPMEAGGGCRLGYGLCGPEFCTVSGDWHLAWELPYNGFYYPYDRILSDMPTYALAVFVLPVLYGAWRFALFNLLMGPVLSGFLTSDTNEIPAIWCLFAIGILLIAFVPPTRRFFEVKDWVLWPKSWRATD